MNYDIVIEFEPKKINLEAYVTGVRPSRTSMKTFYAIRIGTKIEGSPNKIEDQIGRDGRLVTTPPRLNLMRIKTQSFKEIAAQYLWQYAIDNEEEEVDKDEGSEEDEESSSEEEQQQADAAKTTTTMVSPEQAPATKKRKLNDDVPLTVPDFKDEVGPLYPRLCRALGLDNDEFDPTDPSIQKSMVALLSELNRIFSTEYELVVRGYGNKKIHYVRVPRASSDKSFRHSKEWLDAAIKISGSNEASTFNAAYRIANHLFRFYKDSVLAACETQKIAVCKPMTATGYAAMIKAANLTGVGEREVRKYLSAALGRGFCPSRRSVDILSDGHVEVKYNSKYFTFEGRTEEDFIEWTQKDTADAIAWNLSRHLESQHIRPSSVERVEVVAGGDHGDVAFQFGASVHVEMSEGNRIHFEVSLIELICRKDTSELIEETILDELTAGLKKVATLGLHIHRDEHTGNIHCEFSETSTKFPVTTIEKVDCYITGDLAFQAMAMGRESMAGYWCLQCRANWPQFLEDQAPWTMVDLCDHAEEAKRKKKPQMGVKQTPWFEFIPVANHVVPLLHCEIGVGNDLLKMLRNIVNEFIENMTPTEVALQLSIPALRNIILETATRRDEWDVSPEGKLRSTLKRTSSPTDANIDMLKRLEDYRRKTFVDVLTRTHKKVSEHLDQLKKIRSMKTKSPDSIETKMFKVLKIIGVELSAYHGGSLNGKDIKKVMNNATYVFDQFAILFKEGRRPNCVLSEDEIDALCVHFREVFVLWDGTFALARTIDPDDEDRATYRSYVTAAVQGHTDLKCTITPKVHLMLKHVEKQMEYLNRGLGEKMEDWVERLHQDGIRERRQFRSVNNPVIRMRAREKVHVRETHAAVIAFTTATNEGNKRNLSQTKDDSMLAQQKQQREVGRKNALMYFELMMKNKELTWPSKLFDDATGEKIDLPSPPPKDGDSPVK